MRVWIVEDEPYLAEAIRDGLRLEAIVADIASDGNSARELLSVNAYDIAVREPLSSAPARLAGCASRCNYLPHHTQLARRSA